MAVGVTVVGAEEVAAAAPESGESHPPPAAGAAIHGAFGLGRGGLVGLEQIVGIKRKRSFGGA